MSSSNEPSPTKSSGSGYESGPEAKKLKREREMPNFANALDILHPEQRGKDLASCNLNLLESKEFTDITFLVGREDSCQTQFQCHMFILVSRSPVFRAMLGDRWKKRDINIETGLRKPTVLNDIDADTFERFLQFLYGDVFNVTKVAEVEGLLYLARKYCVELLTEKCAQYLNSSVTLKDAVSVYKTANLFALDELQDSCREFVRKNMGLIIEKGRFKDFNIPTLVDVLKAGNVFVREIQLFRAIHRWARLLVVESIEEAPLAADDRNEATLAASIREILAEVSPLVRFPLISLANLCHVVHPSGLLNAEDIASVYQYVGMSPDERNQAEFNLKFPVEPRTTSLSAETFVELYTPKPDGAKPTIEPSQIEYCRMKARTHTETLRFAVNHPDLVNRPSMFISTLVLRGPHDDSIIGSTSYNTIFNSWTVTVTVSSFKRLYGRRCQVETFQRKHIPIYASREAYVDVVPAIRLQKALSYSIRIQYEVDVNFPADYTLLTSSPLREFQAIPSTNSPWSICDIALEADEQPGVDGDSSPAKASHCLRAIGFKETDVDFDFDNIADN